MKEYLKGIIYYYNEKNKENKIIKDQYLNLKKENFLNLSKIDNPKTFILNLYIYNLNNKFSLKYLNSYKNESVNDITLNIFLSSNVYIEDFVRDLNISITSNKFINYVVFLIFINFNNTPDNFLNTKELIRNNIFIIKQ